jgi:hypothetical protein
MTGAIHPPAALGVALSLWLNPSSRRLDTTIHFALAFIAAIH